MFMRRISLSSLNIAVAPLLEHVPIMVSYAVETIVQLKRMSRRIRVKYLVCIGRWFMWFVGVEHCNDQGWVD